MTECTHSWFRLSDIIVPEGDVGPYNPAGFSIECSKCHDQRPWITSRLDNWERQWESWLEAVNRQAKEEESE